MDKDGKVTVEEQCLDRHPLSQLISRESVTNSKTKIPWAVNLFSEWIMSGFVQEDVEVGAVSEHPSRGVLNLSPTQSNVTLQPQKTSANGGVEFAANSGQFLTMAGQRDARWNYRWGVITFRIDANTGSAEETVLLDINQGLGPSKSSPKVWYNKKDGLFIQFVGRGATGLDRRIMNAKNVIADGKTWNVVVFGMRQGRMFASVNGVTLTTTEEQPSRFSSELAYDANSFIGDNRNDGNMAWAYDTILLGQTELTEAMVRKLEGWAAHRLGFQANLPADHPYRELPPVLDEEDLPRRYVHDDEAWTAWGQSLTKSVTRVNTGGDRVEPEGWERVFFDDFRAFRISPSTSNEGDLWQAPGWNTAVGNDARLLPPGATPDVYPHDPENQLQTISIAKQGNTWYGSAFYSVNDLGQGYVWSGPKIFRIRCMFPKIAEHLLPGGLFPAFWSYGIEFLYWRTSNRIEVDWFEFVGTNGYYYNGMSSHLHYTHVKNIFVRQNDSYQRYKVFGGNLTPLENNLGLYVWDGQFHTWEFVVDEDWTYVNVTIPDRRSGTEKWVEVCRCPTPALYLEPMYLLVDYALRANDGLPKSEREDFVIDWIEVLQKTEQINAIPKPFVARPQLVGDAAVGGTLTCIPNVENVTDLRYYWFADGYPLTYGADPTYTLTEVEVGKTIRCMVKAVGALDMPEAWTEPVLVK
ncbi:MAG TPA: hypothetical protein GXX57_08085 [Firmicutes bacterium]|nr:hypothetical protein [Bacillota bacterium]